MTTLPSEMTVPLFDGNCQIRTTTKPVSPPEPGQLLIEVKANAVCGSERPQWTQGTTITPGHEAAGIVVAAGSRTTTPVGTRGVVFLMDFCGICRSCRQGFTNQCLSKRSDMGFNRDGGYGVYELVSENIFFPITDDLPLTEATLLLDVMGTGGHAINRAQLVHKDIQSVLITGAGPIGLGVLAMAKLLLGQDIPVVLSDVVPCRLQLAQRLGGLPILASAMTLKEGLRHHDLDAPDVVIDCAGKGTVRAECLNLIARRGVLVNVAHGEDLRIESVSRSLIVPETAVLGSEYFAYSELETNLTMLRKNRAYLDPIITYRFGVGDIQHAFELFFGGQTGKVVIEQ